MGSHIGCLAFQLLQKLLLLLLNCTLLVFSLQLGLQPILLLLHPNVGFSLADGLFGDLMEQGEVVPRDDLARFDDDLV